MKWFLSADFAASPTVLRKLFCFATQAVTPPAGGVDPGASPAPAGGGIPASPAAGAPSGGTPTPAPSPNDANIRTLRESHERYSKLGKPEELEPVVQGYRTTESKVLEMAQALRYNADQVKAALQRDPVGTIQRLAAEMAEAQRTAADPNADPRDLIRQEVEPLLQPVMQHIATQQAQAANTAFNNAFNDLVGQHEEFKGAPVPDEVKNVLRDMVSESLKYDKEACAALLQGKTSDVKKYFDAVTERFFKVTNAYSQYRTSRPGGGTPATPGTPAAQPQKPTLQDFIEGTDRAIAVAPSFRR